MTTEVVCGLQVNQAGGMARLARSLLKLHMCFMVIYLPSGVLAIVSALTRSENPELGVHGVMRIKTDLAGEIFFGSLHIVLPIVAFFALRYAIRRDDRSLVTGLLCCDGCCSMCHCLLGALGLLVLGALVAGRSHLTPELCRCAQLMRFDVCDASNSCSHCFDERQCFVEVDRFQSNFGFLVSFTSLWTGLVCAQLLCCTLAAVRLSTARQRMIQFPFCRAAPLQGTGSVVVGPPIQGTILVPSAPKLADL